MIEWWSNELVIEWMDGEWMRMNWWLNEWMMMSEWQMDENELEWQMDGWWTTTIWNNYWWWWVVYVCMINGNWNGKWIFQWKYGWNLVDDIHSHFGFWIGMGFFWKEILVPRETRWNGLFDGGGVEGDEFCWWWINGWWIGFSFNDLSMGKIGRHFSMENHSMCVFCNGKNFWMCVFFNGIFGWDSLSMGIHSMCVCVCFECVCFAMRDSFNVFWIDNHSMENQWIWMDIFGWMNRNGKLGTNKQINKLVDYDDE